jgi:electron transfer flavoprotein alpha subunit
MGIEMKTLVIALQRGGKTISTTFELIEAAKTLNGEISTVILSREAEVAGQEIANRGGGKVLALTNPAFGAFNDEIFTNVLADLISRHAPEVVLGPATFYGKALFARLAAKLNAPMVSDAIKIAPGDDNVIATRPSYGGSVISEIASNNGQPLLVTVRPKVYNESTSGAGEVVPESVEESLLQSKMVVTDSKSESGGKVSLTEAGIIVSAGRGIKGPENIPIVQELADSLGAAMGASRAIVDAGWIAYSYQVGQTGKTVNPKLYIAVGISGAIQHLVGMNSSKAIVAVNKDKDAPIFNVASYGIVGDALEIVPALTKKFKAELSD